MSEVVDHAFSARKEHELQTLYQKRIPNSFFWVASTYEVRKRIGIQEQSKAEGKGRNTVI